MLGLDNIGHGHAAPVHNNVGAGNLGPKPRTMKDSKEIMKKRRERAICIVSRYTVLTIKKSFVSQNHKTCILHKEECVI